jgi:KDO2-lipid IV(A) lauroyltransferase
MARATFLHVFTAAVEMVHLDDRIARTGMDGVVDVKGAEHVERALAAGRGCIWVACHLGNWEIAARVAKARGWPLTSVYRALDNPLLDRWMLAQRLAHGQQMVEKHGALRPLVRALRENRIVVLLVDQDAGRHGVFVPFFGTPASTIPTPAELALRTGTVLVPSFPIRTGPGFRHELTFEAPVPAEDTGNHEADVLRITAAINERFEAAVRRTPTQWLWAHRRWKTRPPGESGPASRGTVVPAAGDAAAGGAA